MAHYGCCTFGDGCSSACSIHTPCPLPVFVVAVVPKQAASSSFPDDG